MGYDALSSAIIKLRKALGDDPHHPQFIETISKKGYRLIAPVQETGAVAESHVSQNGGRSVKQSRVNLQFHRPTWLVMTVVLFMLAVVLLNWQPGRLNAPETDDIADVLPVTDTPSVAVLPFSNLSDDPTQTYFSDGITEDLITDLSRLSGLTVIARNSVFSFKGSTPKPQDVARLLGARYVLQGSVRRMEDQVRINVTFIDAVSGHNIWAERFDGSLDDVFILQDQVVDKVVKALKVELTAQELDNLKRPTAANVDALQEYFLGRAIYGSISKQENEVARKRFRRAIELDPNFAQAYASLALTYLDDWRLRWGVSREESKSQAIKLAQKAIEIDPSNPQAHFTLGYIYLYALKAHDRAIEEAKKVHRTGSQLCRWLCPIVLGLFFLGASGEISTAGSQGNGPESGLEFLYYVHLGRSYYYQKQYEDALKAFQNADERNHVFVTNHIWLAATYAQLNQLEEAAWEVDQILTLEPDFSLSHWLDTRPIKKIEHRQHLLDGLRKAGIN